MWHEFVRLSDEIDWDWLDDEIADRFSDDGRPGTESRFMIGVLLLKHIYRLSDEGVFERWVSAAALNRLARGHWSIENSLHWVLDVVMNEDHARAGKDNPKTSRCCAASPSTSSSATQTRRTSRMSSG